MAKQHKKKYGKFYSSEFDNPCKTLLANIRFAGLDKPIKTVVVTSSVMDEGKSTTSSNLACAMASSGKRTLIVDADLRRRSLGSMLGMHNSYGLYSVLSGQATLRQAVAATKFPNLFFLDCETDIANPADVFATQRFGVLMEKLKQSFDYVVFDMPPIGLFVDAAVASNLADGTILCVRRGYTKRDMVDKAIQQLEAAEANVLGIVMTFAEETRNDYYYYYYNEDGSKSKKKRHRNVLADEPLMMETPEEAINSLDSGNIDSWIRQFEAAPAQPEPVVAQEAAPQQQLTRQQQAAQQRAAQQQAAPQQVQQQAAPQQVRQQPTRQQQATQRASVQAPEGDPFAPGAFRSAARNTSAGRSNASSRNTRTRRSR